MAVVAMSAPAAVRGRPHPPQHPPETRSHRDPDDRRGHERQRVAARNGGQRNDAHEIARGREPFEQPGRTAAAPQRNAPGRQQRRGGRHDAPEHQQASERDVRRRRGAPAEPVGDRRNQEWQRGHKWRTREWRRLPGRLQRSRGGREWPPSRGPPRPPPLVHPRRDATTATGRVWRVRSRARRAGCPPAGRRAARRRDHDAPSRVPNRDRHSPPRSTTAANTAKATGAPAASSARRVATHPPGEAGGQHAPRSGAYDTSSHSNVASAAPRTAAAHPRGSSARPGPSRRNDHAACGHSSRWAGGGREQERGRRGDREPCECRGRAGTGDTHGPQPQRRGDDRSDPEAQAGWHAGIVGHRRAAGHFRRTPRANATPAASDATSTRATGHAAARERVEVRCSARRGPSARAARAAKSMAIHATWPAHDPPEGESRGTRERPPGGNHIRRTRGRMEWRSPAPRTRGTTGGRPRCAGTAV